MILLSFRESVIQYWDSLYNVSISPWQIKVHVDKDFGLWGQNLNEDLSFGIETQCFFPDCLSQAYIVLRFEPTAILRIIASLIAYHNNISFR